ncbi:MAG: hypothetical protein Roseis2KO_24960 [Roseivirga sp.]
MKLKAVVINIVANVPSDHEMGPWCPTNIADDAEAGAYGWKTEKFMTYSVPLLPHYC